MSNHFDLIVTAQADTLAVHLSLRDANGHTLAQHDADLGALAAGQLQALFDLREFVHRYAAAGQEAAEVEAVGVCIAEQVLGDAIFGHLWRPTTQRTLRIQLPGAAHTGAGGDANPLAAALARVPWEIARPAPGKPSLAERNLLVRVVHDMRPPAAQPLTLQAGKALRVLLVQAEARGARPLGMRAERLALQDSREIVSPALKQGWWAVLRRGFVAWTAHLFLRLAGFSGRY